jgi:CubicO group peptidase (beta-lactamase class C family)
MVKTITAMLIGIAISEGAIHSVDDTAETYVPELKGTEIGHTPIRALLHMASGIAFTEDYSGTDDNAKLGRLRSGKVKMSTVEALSQFNKRIAPPDTLWYYKALDPEVLGLVLTRATHMTMSEYLQTRIWQPMGAESSAKWETDNSGQEVAAASFNATLRDYARFGLILAHDGFWNGHQIIPRQWLLDATQPAEQNSFRAFGGAIHPWGMGI